MLKARKVIASVLGAAALAGGGIAAADAAALSIPDTYNDTYLEWGSSPTRAMRDHTDLRKVEYWRGTNGQFYVRWHFTNLRSDHRKPLAWLVGRYGNYNIGVSYGSSQSHVTWPGGVRCYGTGAYDYTNNHITVHFMNSCMPKGVRMYPHAEAGYMNTGDRINLSDDRKNVEGPSIVFNP